MKRLMLCTLIIVTFAFGVFKSKEKSYEEPRRAVVVDETLLVYDDTPSLERSVVQANYVLANRIDWLLKGQEVLVLRVKEGLKGEIWANVLYKCEIVICTINEDNEITESRAMEEINGWVLQEWNGEWFIEYLDEESRDSKIFFGFPLSINNEIVGYFSLGTPLYAQGRADVMLKAIDDEPINYHWFGIIVILITIVEAYFCFSVLKIENSKYKFLTFLLIWITTISVLGIAKFSDVIILIRGKI